MRCRSAVAAAAAAVAVSAAAAAAAAPWIPDAATAAGTGRAALGWVLVMMVIPVGSSFITAAEADDGASSAGFAACFSVNMAKIASDIVLWVPGAKR